MKKTLALILSIIFLSLFSCKKQSEQEIKTIKASYSIIIPDTLRLGKNTGRITNFRTDSNDIAEYFLMVVVDNQYSESLIRKDTFGGTLSPFFGINTYKEGLQEIKFSVETKRLTNSNDSSKVTVTDFIEYYTEKFYVADEKYTSDISEKLKREVEMEYKK